MSLHWQAVETRLGRFLVFSQDGKIVHMGLPTHDELTILRRVHQAYPTEEPTATANPVLLEAAKQLSEYAEGLRTEFQLPLAPAGTEFQQSVWGALTEIPFGETRSYGDVAQEIQKPGASRAVGQANGRNPIPVIIPCHRVLAADGGIGGYSGEWGEGGGITFKQRLLELETKGKMAMEEPAGAFATPNSI